MTVKRIKYIDITRGIAICMIVLGHTIVYSNHLRGLYQFLYSFHVVLFFVISGMIFKIKKEQKITDIIQKKFQRIMIPYFIWSFLFLIPYLIAGQDVGNSLSTTSSFNINTQFLNILYGNGNLSALKQNSSLWFLPALFTIECLYYIIIKKSINNNINKDIGMLIIILIISYIFSKFCQITFPWGINTAIELGPFFYLGHMIKKYNMIEKFVSKSKIKQFFMIIICIVIGTVACFTNKSIVSAIDYRYGYFILAIASGLFLSTAIILVSCKIDKNILFEFIGKNTMGILIFHKIIIILFQSKVPYINNWLSNSHFIIEITLSISIAIIAIAFSIAITKIVEKIMPFSLGIIVPKKETEVISCQNTK